MVSHINFLVSPVVNGVQKSKPPAYETSRDSDAINGVCTWSASGFKFVCNAKSGNGDIRDQSERS